MMISVSVRPSSAIEGVEKTDDCYVVSVREPPRDGKANLRVVKLLADYFGVSYRQVRLKTSKGRKKIVEIITTFS